MEKLILHAEEDALVCDEGPVAPQDVEPATHADAMIPLLENEIRTISTLKELEIKGSTDLSFAEPTITWLQERNKRRIREALKGEEEEENPAEVVRSANHPSGSAERGLFGPSATISATSVEIMDTFARIVLRGYCKRTWGQF